MRVIIGEGRRGPVVSSFIVVAAVALLGTTIVSNTRVSVAAPLIGATVALVLGYRRLLTWRALIGLTIFIILFIPIRRYALPSALPFQLEPYRLVIAFIAVGWISSLLVDPRVRLRGTTIDTPLMFFLIVILLSLIANPKRVSAVEQDTVKKLMFFASFFIVYYLVASVAHRFRDVDFLAQDAGRRRNGGRVLHDHRSEDRIQRVLAPEFGSAVPAPDRRRACTYPRRTVARTRFVATPDRPWSGADDDCASRGLPGPLLPPASLVVRRSHSRLRRSVNGLADGRGHARGDRDHASDSQAHPDQEAVAVCASRSRCASFRIAWDASARCAARCSRRAGSSHSKRMRASAADGLRRSDRPFTKSGSRIRSSARASERA